MVAQKIITESLPLHERMCAVFLENKQPLVPRIIWGEEKFTVYPNRVEFWWF